MKESELIKECKSFLIECSKEFNGKGKIFYHNRAIEELIEQLIILIESKNELIKMHISDANILFNRLSHLLLSNTIKEYDAKNIKTGEYIKDINELDIILKENVRKEN